MREEYTRYIVWMVMLSVVDLMVIMSLFYLFSHYYLVTTLRKGSLRGEYSHRTGGEKVHTLTLMYNGEHLHPYYIPWILLSSYMARYHTEQETECPDHISASITRHLIVRSGRSHDKSILMGVG
jgi:hypothetical protein